MLVGCVAYIGGNMTLIVRAYTITIMIVSVLGRVNLTKDTLHLGVMVSQEGDLNLSGYIPAMDMALETINNDTTLPFNFNVALNDSMCLAAPATRGFIHQVSSTTENKIMIVGADCSVSTEPVAELSPHWNLVQIAPSSTSPRLSNNQTFPRFLRAVSSEAETSIGIVNAMKQFGWSRIAVITQTDNLFTFIASNLRQVLAASNLQLIREFTFNPEEHPREVVNSLKNSPARIVFLNMYQVHAAEALCQAYKNQMFHPTYAWIYFNWYLDNWWMTANSSCVSDGSVKGEDLERLLRFSLAVDHYPRVEENRRDEQNIGNITWNRYLSEHKKRFPKVRTVVNTTDPAEDESAFMFDAMWTAALALNRTATRLRKDNLTLLDFDYDDEHNISRIIYEEALNVKFFGLTGDVYFLPNGDRPGQVRLLQYRITGTGENRSLEKVRFARIIDGAFVYENGESDSTVYPDEIPQDEEHIYIALPLFIVYTIIASFGIIFAVICLIINLWLRNRKLVKLSSPYVNIMIAAGVVVLYVTVITFGVDENIASYSTVDNLCPTRIWLVSIGFSLLYGTIIAKTWRIYYIFSHTKPNTKISVKDIYLFMIVGALVAVDIVFLIPVTAVSSARLRREYREIEGEGNDLPRIIGVCESEDSDIWFPVLFAYKGIVLLAGLFLAFETRKVRIKSLNESRFIAMSIYGAVIVSITLTPIGFWLRNFPTVQYGLSGIMIMSSMTLILGLIFVARWYKVYRDPQGLQCLDNTTDSTNNNTKISVASTDDSYYKSRIQELNKEIIALNKKNKVLNNENKTLNERLAKFSDKEVMTIEEDTIADTTM